MIECNKQVRYKVEHEKRNSIYVQATMNCFGLYKCTCTYTNDNFLTAFQRFSKNFCLKAGHVLGRVVRKLFNANPGLKVNWGNSISCLIVLSMSYVSCSWRLLLPKTEGQKI